MRRNRQNRCNQCIRDKLYHNDIYICELSVYCGVSSSTLYKWLNLPLDNQREKRIERAIKQIREERRLFYESD